MNGFSFLFGNVLLHHLICDRPGADSQVPPGPNMPTPQMLAQMWELLKKHPRARTFQPLHHFADVLMGMVGNENVNMVV